MDKKVIDRIMGNLQTLFHEDGVVYVTVQEIKDKFPDLKIDISQIRDHRDEKLGDVKLVPIDAISEMTEFDKKIRQSLNFNPKP